MYFKQHAPCESFYDTPVVMRTLPVCCAIQEIILYYYNKKIVEE